MAEIITKGFHKTEFHTGEEATVWDKVIMPSGVGTVAISFVLI